MLSKKILGIIAVIIVALLIIVFVSKSQRTANNSNQNTNTAPVIAKSEVPTSQLPNKFPGNLPMEAGAEITGNYNATTPDGRFQATRSFVTKQTLAANLKLYSDYLKNNGWTSLAVVDQTTYKMVVGTKGNQQLQISIDENASSKVKTVTITLTEFK